MSVIDEPHEGSLGPQGLSSHDKKNCARFIPCVSFKNDSPSSVMFNEPL
jgi:hypothetical protein